MWLRPVTSICRRFSGAVRGAKQRLPNFNARVPFSKYLACGVETKRCEKVMLLKMLLAEMYVKYFAVKHLSVCLCAFVCVCLLYFPKICCGKVRKELGNELNFLIILGEKLNLA